MAADNKKKQNKLLTAVCALIVAIMLVSVGVTFAAWSANTSETNVVTIGNVKIQLIDEYNEHSNVAPQVNVDKTVSVKNTGNTSCYVRVFVKKEWRNTSGAVVTNPSADVIQPNYANSQLWVRADVTQGTEYVGWECYYYQKELAANSEAEKPLFESFQLTEAFDPDKFGNYEGHIIVKAEAVQSKYVNDTVLVKNSSGQIVGWSHDLVFN